MYDSLQDKVVVLTGASSGIGKVTALRYAEEGAKLVLAARREKEGEEVAELVREKGVEAIFVQTDIAVRDDCRNLVKAAVDAFGRIDVACNNAGIEGDTVPIAEQSDENFERVIDTNVKGSWYCMQSQLQQMIAQGQGGNIVNVGSLLSLMALAGSGAYCASKHAMAGMTKCAAQENAEHNIRVNLVCPALIETAMADRFTGGPGTAGEDYIMSITPMRRRGTPLEVAELILWLSDSASSYVTGGCYPVDGGAFTV